MQDQFCLFLKPVNRREALPIVFVIALIFPFLLALLAYLLALLAYVCVCFLKSLINTEWLTAQEWTAVSMVGEGSAGELLSVVKS